MGIFDTFSKRQKKLKGEISDIYTYDKIPQKLRVQIVHIIDDAIGSPKPYISNMVDEVYKFIHDTICREYGIFTLSKNTVRDDVKSSVLNFLLQAESTEEVLDITDLTFKYINTVLREDNRQYSYYTEVKITPDEAIKELNYRFKENAVGYSFDGNEILKIDSTFIHSEITKPTISLLYNSKFEGANEEYLKAHEHYRHGRNKECLTECLKAFESTLKIICKEKGWTCNSTDTAKALIQTCFINELVPSFTQNQFTSLKNLLESGIPTIRNKLGGHGQGQVPQTVDDGMTRYGLNLTGTSIIFLIEQSKI